MENGRILRDNVYGTIDEDAWRRDFTINALYYDISDFSMRDYAGGLIDIRNGVIRLLGDPETRYREDPVRLLRAVRFAAKLGFRIEPVTEAPLFRLGDLLADVPPARLFEEALKLLMTGHGVQTFELLRRYSLFSWLFPETESALAQEEQGFPVIFLVRALQNTDQRVLEDKPVTPAFLFAALLWEPVRQLAEDLAEEDEVDPGDLREAADEILEIQRQRIAIPKRYALPMREIWELQPRFHRRGGKRVFRLLAHPRFRAAYDFMCLRAESGEELGEVCEWWTAFQSAGATEQRKMAEITNTRRRRRRRPARKRVESHADDVTPPQS
jgi:poly(A) polymerase